MAAAFSSHVRPSCRSVKRLKTAFLPSQNVAAFASTQLFKSVDQTNISPNDSAMPQQSDSNLTSANPPSDQPRLPRGVQAVYLKPLQRQPKHGIPCCDLQLRSYSVRNVEFYSDFAMRAAYYLNLPASGPAPLPKIVERWTVPKGHFVHKKTQENFERVTLRRLVQIQDGHSDTIDIWLAFLKKHAFYGVGMKANVWRYDKLGVGSRMEEAVGEMKPFLESTWARFGHKSGDDTSDLAELITSETSRVHSREEAQVPR